MQKTILVPIDFQIESLNTLKIALKSNEENLVSAVLMYAEHLSDSITDLLFYSPNKKIESLITEDFNDALTILHNRFQQTFVDFRIEFFNGNTTSAFKNFVIANKVDEIYVPKNYQLKSTENSFNPLRLISNSGLPIFNMDWQNNSQLSASDQLNALFNN